MKYPRIPHVPWSHVYDPDDIITPSSIAGTWWHVTEKIDGSQLGIQFSLGNPDARNRNTDILHGGSDRQFDRFHSWFSDRYTALRELLGDHLILFGEWLVHVHTIKYTRLPDWFIGFGLYDKVERVFVEFTIARKMMVDAGLHVVPLLASTTIRDETHLLSFIGQSSFGDEEMEGIVLHSDDGQSRVKFVTERFKHKITAAGKHWRWRWHRDENELA